MTEKELEFAIFCIENTAVALNCDGQMLYNKLTKDSDILYGYIVPAYEALHTQGKEYIVNDILEVLNARGVAV